MERAVVDLRTHRGGDRRRPRVPPDRRVGQSALGPRRRRISGATDSRRRDRRQGRQLRHLRTEPRAAHSTALVSGSLPIALVFCFASFVRFEAIAIYSEEAKDKRTVPRAAFLAVIVIGAVYMRRRRICHCDASFRPQLGRARISPSWKGWAQRSPESATSSDDQSVAGTVRPLTPTVFRFSTGASDLFLNRSRAGPAFTRKQAMQLASRCALFPRSSSLCLTGIIARERRLPGQLDGATTRRRPPAAG